MKINPGNKPDTGTFNSIPNWKLDMLNLQGSTKGQLKITI
jgi:hypothetical protein